MTGVTRMLHFSFVRDSIPDQTEIICASSFNFGCTPLTSCSSLRAGEQASRSACARNNCSRWKMQARVSVNTSVPPFRAHERQQWIAHYFCSRILPRSAHETVWPHSNQFRACFVDNFPPACIKFFVHANLWMGTQWLVNKDKKKIFGDLFQLVRHAQHGILFHADT